MYKYFWGYFDLEHNKNKCMKFTGQYTKFCRENFIEPTKKDLTSHCHPVMICLNFQVYTGISSRSLFIIDYEICTKYIPKEVNKNVVKLKHFLLCINIVAYLSRVSCSSSLDRNFYFCSFFLLVSLVLKKLSVFL